MTRAREFHHLRRGGIHPRPTPPREAFRPEEWKLIQQLRTPEQVQKFLRSLPYNYERHGETLRTFRGVVAHQQAHCLEAALTAAAILEQHRYPPLLLDLESQDALDHVVFVFRDRGRWGAIAKSRDFGLHGRKPVYRTLRDLVFSYVDPYVDGKGRITGYGVADLRDLVSCDWRLSERNAWEVERALIRLPHQTLKTSDRRYHAVLRRYRAFKQKYPDRVPDFYSHQELWM